MNIDKRIENIKLPRNKIRGEDLSYDLYLIAKELNNKFETLKDITIELKNQIQQIKLIQGNKNVQ